MRIARQDRVTSVAGKTGDVALAKADVGLSNVDNTPDASKPISTAVANALAGKADRGPNSSFSEGSNPTGYGSLGSLDTTSKGSGGVFSWWATTAGGEGAAIGINGDTCVIVNPGDALFLRIVDEDTPTRVVGTYGGGSSWTSGSDLKLKTNLVQKQVDIGALLDLQAYSFEWRSYLDAIVKCEEDIERVDAAIANFFGEDDSEEAVALKIESTLHLLGLTIESALKRLEVEDAVPDEQDDSKDKPGLNGDDAFELLKQERARLEKKLIRLNRKVRDYGFIAQDIQKFAPECVEEVDGILHVNWGKFNFSFQQALIDTIRLLDSKLELFAPKVSIDNLVDSLDAFVEYEANRSENRVVTVSSGGLKIKLQNTSGLRQLLDEQVLNLKWRIEAGEITQEQAVFEYFDKYSLRLIPMPLSALAVLSDKLKSIANQNFAARKSEMIKSIEAIRDHQSTVEAECARLASFIAANSSTEISL